MSQEATERARTLPDTYVLERDDADLIGYVLDGRNFSYTIARDGGFTWGAFGTTFSTLGDVRRLAKEHPAAPDDVLPVVEGDGETVGIDLFENMLDTIAFLRVRLRALADVVIERGLVSGPELLARYHEYHERSFEAFRDLMLLRPEIFERRFAEWLQTENAYRAELEGRRDGAGP